MTTPGPSDLVRDGLFDTNSWPGTLSATVVSPGVRPRIHGYDVEGDLALNYRFSDLVFLTLTGELPTASQSTAFDVTMQFAAPLAVNEAPTHAAVLSRLCGGDAGAVLSTAAIALAEQARYLANRLGPWTAWLSSPVTTAVPEEAIAKSEGDRQAVARLRDALSGSGDPVIPALGQDISREAAIVASLFACGLRRSDQIERALVVARLPAVMAEGMAVQVADFRNYPAQLPAVRYEDVP
jgi:hypothetical protein